MKKILLILLINTVFVHILNSQTLIQQIEDAYNALDTVSYIENIILSYKESLLKSNRNIEILALERRDMNPTQKQTRLDNIMERYDTMVLVYRKDLPKKKVLEKISAKSAKQIAYINSNIDDPIKRYKILDSIWIDISKFSMETSYSRFIATIKDKPVHYVLNLKIDSCEQSGKHICLLPDTGRLLFNIFCFGKIYKDEICIFVDNGQYSYFRTYSRPYEEVQKAFRIIMQKNPKYLLFCYELEGMNAILYVLNDKIYIYRIIQMEEYELNDYLEKYPIRKSYK